jgi:hypothetical protein
MNTFRNKQFKNQLDPKYAFYDCLRSCELRSSSKKSLEKCEESCDWNSSKKSLEECEESFDWRSPSKHSNNAI